MGSGSDMDQIWSGRYCISDSCDAVDADVDYCPLDCAVSSAVELGSTMCRERDGFRELTYGECTEFHGGSVEWFTHATGVIDGDDGCSHVACGHYNGVSISGSDMDPDRTVVSTRTSSVEIWDVAFHILLKLLTELGETSRQHEHIL